MHTGTLVTQLDVSDPLGTRSRLSVAGIGVWRYSLFQAEQLPLDGFDDPTAEAETVRILLAVDDIRRKLNELDGGPGGDRFTRLFRSLSSAEGAGALTSDVMREMEYAGHLLFSLHYRNDTGRKGGLSPFLLTPHALSFMEYLDGVADLTEKQVSVRRKDGTPLLADLYPYLDPSFALRDTDTFVFPVELRERIRLGADARDDVTNAMARVATYLVSKSWQQPRASSFGVVPFSVDFFIGTGELKILEVHCPPRGIETMFLPFRPFAAPDVCFPGDVYVSAVAQAFRRFYGRDPRKVALFYPVAGTSFVNREVTRLAMLLQQHCACEVSIVGPTTYGISEEADGLIVIRASQEYPDILIFADAPEKSTYNSNAIQLVVPEEFAINATADRIDPSQSPIDLKNMALPFSILPMGVKPDWSALEQRLGKWLVAKEVQHNAWWSGLKMPLKFLNIRNVRHQRKLVNALARRPLRVESFYPHSRDEHGHFGELRVFGVIVTEGADSPTA